MAFKSLAAKKAYQKEYRLRKYRERVSTEEGRQKERARSYESNKKARNGAYALVERARRNEHNFRMRQWEMDHRSELEQLAVESDLAITNIRNFNNPMFVVVDKYGRRRTEWLLEALPKWTPAPTATEKEAGE